MLAATTPHQRCSSGLACSTSTPLAFGAVPPRRLPRRRAAAAAAPAAPPATSTLLTVDGKHSVTSPAGWDAMRAALIDAGVRVVSPQEVGFSAERGAAVIVDVRPEADYEKGHLPGAASVPFYSPITGWTPFKVARRLGYAAFGVLNGTEVNESFVADVAALLEGERGGDSAGGGADGGGGGGSVVLYCSQGGVLESSETYRRGWQTRSLVAAYALLRSGVVAGSSLAVMRGGYTEWCAGGRLIEVFEDADD